MTESGGEIRKELGRERQCEGEIERQGEGEIYREAGRWRMSARLRGE